MRFRHLPVTLPPALTPAVTGRLERALPAEHAALLRSVLRTCANLRVEVARELSSAERVPRAAAAQRAASLNTLICILGLFFGQASRDELEAWGDDAGLGEQPNGEQDAELVYAPG